MWSWRGCKADTDSSGTTRTPEKDDVTRGILKDEDHFKCVCYFHHHFDYCFIGLFCVKCRYQSFYCVFETFANFAKMYLYLTFFIVCTVYIVFICDFTWIAESIYFGLQSSNSRSLIYLVHVLGKQKMPLLHTVYISIKKICTY